MDAENKPAADGADAASPVASDQSAARWRLILLVLCAVGAGLVVVILALQVTEYLFYKAPPNVWPQSGAGGMVSAPAALAAPLLPAPTMPSALPVPEITTTAPSATVVSTGVLSAPVVAATSAPAPTAAAP